MDVKLTRRSLFNGLLAMSTVRFIPSMVTEKTVESLAVNELNPFALGNADRLTEMIIALLDDQHKMEAIGVLRSMPSFRYDMLSDIGTDESVADAMTRHLGEGEWTKWSYTLDDVMEALTSFDRRDQVYLQTLAYGEPAVTSDADQSENVAKNPTEMPASA